MGGRHRRDHARATRCVDKAAWLDCPPLAYIGLMELGATCVLGSVLFARRDALRREWRSNRTAVVDRGRL
jgi:hypothetical protein